MLLSVVLGFSGAFKVELLHLTTANMSPRKR